MFIEILLILLGFVFLIKGADFLVDGASSLAKKFGIPEIVIGLTIVSIGTSMPELFVSITSAIEGYSDMAIGNVLGSNICNLLLILGISSIVSPVIFQKETKWFEIPLSFIFTVLFLIFCNSGLGITRKESVILIFFFFLFILYNVLILLKNKNDNCLSSSTKKSIPVLKNILLVIVGIALLKVGGDFTVDNAVLLAARAGISEKVISLTILAVGTSLPELVTSVVASYRGNSDIAIGNIIGSNIFNMLLIIGVSSFITPIMYNLSYNFELIVLIISTLLLWLFPLIPKKDEMSKGNGMVYLSLYILYLLILFIN